MAVLDGRPELAEEIPSGPEDVRAYIAAEFRKLFATVSSSMHYPANFPTKRVRLAPRYCLSDCKDSGPLVEKSLRVLGALLAH